MTTTAIAAAAQLTGPERDFILVALVLGAIAAGLLTS